jgi:hypothetical protein
LTIKKKDIDLKNQTIYTYKSNNINCKIAINEDAIEWFKKKLKNY